MEKKELGAKEFIGKGMLGKVYKLENGNVYKEFNRPDCISEIDRFKYFLEYKNDSIVFPFDFVYGKTKFYGHISKYALGNKFVDAVLDSNIEDMSTNIIMLENDIKKISEGKIIMFDFHDENLLYDGKKFSVIDVDEYSYSSRVYSKYDILEKNSGYLNNLIIMAFLENIDKNKNYFCDKFSKYKYVSSASELLLLMKETLDKYYREDIKSLGDIKKISR